MRFLRWMLCTGLCACAYEPATYPPTPVPPGTSSQVITILNYTFSPQRLVVTPGSTVLVLNDDPVEHTVTSEATAGSYVFGGVGGIAFDTGPFLGVAAFGIAADAPPGTVVPYFCGMHLSAMLNQGEIEIAGP